MIFGQSQSPMTRGEVASERKRKPLALSTFLVWRSLCTIISTHSHKLNHASSTARVEEGKHLCLLSIAPKLTSTQYLDRRLFVQLNGSRKVIGVLRGYDVRKSSLDTVAHVY